MKVTYIHFHDGIPRYVGEGSITRAKNLNRKESKYGGGYGRYLAAHRDEHICVVICSSHLDKVGSWLQEQGLISWLGQKCKNGGPLLNIAPYGDGHPQGMSDEGRESLRRQKTGIPRGPEFSKTMQEAHETRTYYGWNVDVECPHCGKIGPKSSMRRWHFDHCEENPNRTPPNVPTGMKRQVVTCPHCGKSGGLNVMPRYHFDNCKHKL